MTPLRRREAHHVKQRTWELGKFRGLRIELGLDRRQTIATLEMMWHFSAVNAPRGDVGRWDDAIIADAVDYTEGPPEKVIAALVKWRWLDVSDEHRLVVHNWTKHCDSTAHIAVALQHEFFVDGMAPRAEMLRRMSKGPREEAIAFYRSARERGVPACRRLPVGMPAVEPTAEPPVNRQQADGRADGQPAAEPAVNRRLTGGESAAVPPPAQAQAHKGERERGGGPSTEGVSLGTAALSGGRLREVSSPVVPGRAAGLAAVWRECRVAFDPACNEADADWWRTIGEPAAFKAFLPLVGKRSPGVLEPALRWAFTSPPNPANNWPGWGAQLDEPVKFASKVGIIVKQWEAADQAAKGAKPPAPPPRAADPLFKSWGELGWNHRHGRITDEQLEHQRGLMRAAGIKQDQGDLAKWAKEPPPVKGGLEQALRHRATA